jgi:serine/threonine protein kinase
MLEDRLNSLLLAWEEHQFQGRDVAVAELCRDCPELTGKLRQRIDILRRLHKLMQAADAASGSSSSGAPAPAIENWQTDIARDSREATGNRAGAGSAEATPVSVSVPGYDILGELGRGGMGVVYKARQISLHRVVALKMILAGSHASAGAAARFLHEAEIIARLKHPNIVQVYDYGNHEGKPYFSLEHLEGGSLADRLQRKPLPVPQAAHLVQTLAQAVRAAHAQGIIHRDLKPANVLLTADGTPKITDFGLAKLLVGDSAVRTQTGDIIGTPSYMAPEQAGGKAKRIGPAADIYGLGAILYELLTGRPPFRAETPLQTLLQVQAQDPILPSRLRPKLPRDLQTICLKAIAKAPDDAIPARGTWQRIYSAG